MKSEIYGQVLLCTLENNNPQVQPKIINGNRIDNINSLWYN